MEKIMDKFSIQLFADGEGGGDPGNPPAPPGGEGGRVEVPSYITDYANGITDAEAKSYVEGLLKDEKGVNFVKQFIKDPNEKPDYSGINKEDYKDIETEAEAFLEAAKEKGWSAEYVKNQLDNRKAYLAREREAMTPELRSLDGVIENFIGAETDAGKKGIYARLAENAIGRQVLQELISLKGGTVPPGSPGNNGGGTGGAYTRETFVEAYNNALDTKDMNKLESLKTFAKSQKDSYFRDFLGI